MPAKNVDDRYKIKTKTLLHQKSLRRTTDVISTGLLVVERQETERQTSPSNLRLNRKYEGPTLNTPKSETLIMIFPFVKNLSRKAQLTQS